MDAETDAAGQRPPRDPTGLGTDVQPRCHAHEKQTRTEFMWVKKRTLFFFFVCVSAATFDHQTELTRTKARFLLFFYCLL